MKRSVALSRMASETSDCSSCDDRVHWAASRVSGLYGSGGRSNETEGIIGRGLGRELGLGGVGEGVDARTGVGDEGYSVSDDRANVSTES